MGEQIICDLNVFMIKELRYFVLENRDFRYNELDIVTLDIVKHSNAYQDTY